MRAALDRRPGWGIALCVLLVAVVYFGVTHITSTCQQAATVHEQALSSALDNAHTRADQRAIANGALPPGGC